MRRHGFTLIELSIAIVIIGLIVGGVLVGRDLIQAANTRILVKELQTLDTAMNVFRLKYNGLPGDIRNATQFWGQDASCPNTPANAVKKMATCNGNGNGFIFGATGCVHSEVFRSIQQLANAGFIEGSYTGVSDNHGCGAVAVIGQNIPASKYKGVGYTLGAGAETRLCHSGDSTHFDDCRGNEIRLGGQRYGFSAGPILPPVVARDVDVKLDDGKPAYGKIRADKRSSTVIPNCTTSNTASSAEYDTLSKANLCSLRYKLD